MTQDIDTEQNISHQEISKKTHFVLTVGFFPPHTQF